MRVNNNNNNTSFGIADVLTPRASKEFEAKILGMKAKLCEIGHPSDICHLKEISLGRVWAVLTLAGSKDKKVEEKGFRIFETVQAAAKKMVPIRTEQANSSIVTAAVDWWKKQIQEMGFIGQNIPADSSHVSRTGIFQRITPDEATKFAEELKPLVMKSLKEEEPLELDFFVESSILRKASAQAGIQPYYAPFRPKMTIKNGIIQISSAKTVPEEKYRLPKELMPEELC